MADILADLFLRAGGAGRGEISSPCRRSPCTFGDRGDFGPQLAHGRAGSVPANADVARNDCRFIPNRHSMTQRPKADASVKAEQEKLRREEHWREQPESVFSRPSCPQTLFD